MLWGGLELVMASFSLQRVNYTVSSASPPAHDRLPGLEHAQAASPVHLGRRHISATACSPLPTHPSKSIPKCGRLATRHRQHLEALTRSEERAVGKEEVRACRRRGS